VAWRGEADLGRGGGGGGIEQTVWKGLRWVAILCGSRYWWRGGEAARRVEERCRAVSGKSLVIAILMARPGQAWRWKGDGEAGDLDRYIGRLCWNTEFWRGRGVLY
jgi:hypothetical protein